MALLPAVDERFQYVIDKSRWTNVSHFCIAVTSAFSILNAATAASKASTNAASASPSASTASPASTTAPSVADKNAQPALKKAKSAYQAGQFKDAEDRLNRLAKQGGKSPSTEEVMVILADVELRLNHPEQAIGIIGRFRRQSPTSVFLPRMNYYQGQAYLRLGKNNEAAKSFASAATLAQNAPLSMAASKGLWHIIDNGGLVAEDVDAISELLDRDPTLKSGFLEHVGDQRLREGRYQAARNTFEDWLEKYGATDGASRIKAKLKQAVDAPQLNRTLLLMAPMSGEFLEIGKALKEGAMLAVDENNARGVGGRIETRILDDQGNLIVGIHRLRKLMRDEKIDAVLGPAMSDVSAAVAVDLSARKSKVPLVTPTATTHGIAALGDGIFQLNVTTGTLGQRVASYAVGCLKLKDFAIVAPNSEYGYQLAEAFQKTVEKKGGNIVSTQFYESDVSDLAPQYQEIRKQAVKIFFEKLKESGGPDPDSKAYAKALSDSTLFLDGIFMPATNGEEAYKVASQASFNKLRAQFLGSSGWNDKSIMYRSGAPALLGSVFSVDFQENSKTEAWIAFNRTFAAKWKHSPDKVAALSYDATKFLLQGMSTAAGDDQLIPSLKAIRTFNGVLGKIVFDDKYGVNTNAALFRIEKKGFKEVESCPEAD